MLSVLEAREAILKETRILGVESVSIIDAAGRVSAEVVSASRQQPPWDNSAMDGFAVRSVDLQDASETNPVPLRIIEDIMAGVVGQKTVGPGQASRIMTGAPMPEGADAVIRVELTRELSRDTVEMRSSVGPGNDIRRAGEDQEIGDVLLKPGKVIRPAEIGLLASAPRALMSAYRRPIVAVIATGDELVEPDRSPSQGQIINTNAYAIAAMVQEAGAIPRILPIARDTREHLRETFLQAKGVDAILSLGGVSVGDHDYVREVLMDVGVSMGFWKVRMTPGKPLAFGHWDSTLVLGLPGNPVSCMVSFELFARPALLRMAGRERIYRRMFKATLTDTMRKRPKMLHFLRVVLREEGGRWYAGSTGPQGSGILRSMSVADGLAVGEEGLEEVVAGTEVWVMPLDDQIALSSHRPV